MDCKPSKSMRDLRSSLAGEEKGTTVSRLNYIVSEVSSILELGTRDLGQLDLGKIKYLNNLSYLYICYILHKTKSGRVNSRRVGLKPTHELHEPNTP